MTTPESSDIKSRIPRLTSSNFPIWKVRISAKIRTLGASDILSGVETCPRPSSPYVPNTTVTEDAHDRAAAKRLIAIASWTKRDADAFNIIVENVDDNMITQFGNKGTSLEIWKIVLSVNHDTHSGVTAFYIKIGIIERRYIDGTPIADHIGWIRTENQRLQGMKKDLDDEFLALLLLHSLPKTETWTRFISNTVEATSDTVPLTVAHVESRLLRAESLSQDDPIHGQSALAVAARQASASQTKAKPPRPLCTNCRKGPHKAEDCRGEGGGKFGVPFDNQLKAATPTVAYARPHIYSGSPHAFLASKFNVNANLATRKALDDILIDSGCSCHISPRRDWFEKSTFRQLDNPVSIDLGDASSILATGIGTIHLKLDINGNTTYGYIANVLYAERMATTLLSVADLTKRNHTLTFDGNHCNIKSKTTGALVGIASRQGPSDLYRLLACVTHDHVSVNTATTRSIDINILHRRLGHLGFDNVRRLVTQGMVEDISKLTGTQEFCESCALGKAHRLPFPNNKTTVNNVLDLIHSDVCGPLPSSIGGKRYFVTFTDDHSRRKFLYLLSAKSEVLPSFLEFKASVEKETGRQIKIIRSDNGGEYTSLDFQRYLTTEGITAQTSTPYTPEQNGLSEQGNRTIVEKIRPMLKAAGMSNGFWAEAALTATYLGNVSPHAALNDKTPMEVWSKKRPHILGIREFGTIAYAFIPKALRKKLDDKSDKCVLLGYAVGSKAYRLWRISDHRVIISRDVQFNEGSYLQDAPQEPDIWPDENTETTQANDTLPDEEEDPPTLNNPPLAPIPAPIVPIPDIVPGRPQRDHRPPAWRQEDINNASSESDFLQAAGYLATAPTTVTATTVAIHEHNVFALTAVTTPQSADEPRSYKEAMRSVDADKWKQGIDEELQSILENKTFKTIKRADVPEGRKLVGSKLVFKLKRDATGNVVRHKVRLVAQGFSQIPGIDYLETYAPVTKIASIRLVCALSAIYDLDLEQLDIKTAYLNGYLKEEIYMKPPEGVGADSNDIWLLLRTLYGLKQSGKVWNDLINGVLIELGFIACAGDKCLYVYNHNMIIIIIALYVDDMLAANNSATTWAKIKRKLKEKFNITEMGEAHFLLGMEIIRDRPNRTITLSQKRYIQDICERYGMADANTVRTPMNTNTPLSITQSPQTDAEHAEMKYVPYQNLTGSLLYAAMATRPDIAFAVGSLCRFNSNYGNEHWLAAKRVIRYLKGTQELSLVYDGKLDHNLSAIAHGFSDADWAGDIDSRKSTSGYVFMMAGAAVTWSSKAQTTPALSSTEAEYVSSTRAAQESIWLRNILTDLGSKPTLPTTIWCDNQSAIALATNTVDTSSRMKHIDVRHHFIREAVIEKHINIQWCPTEDQAADILTKALPRIKHEYFVQLLGMVPRLRGGVET